jgi:hypothetical protein
MPGVGAEKERVREDCGEDCVQREKNEHAVTQRPSYCGSIYPERVVADFGIEIKP